MPPMLKGHLYHKEDIAEVQEVHTSTTGAFVFALNADQCGWCVEDGELFVLEAPETDMLTADAEHSGILLFMAVTELADFYRCLGSATSDGYKSGVDIATVTGTTRSISGPGYRLARDERFRVDLLRDDWLRKRIQPKTPEWELHRLRQIVNPLGPADGALVSGVVWFGGCASPQRFGELMWDSVDAAFPFPDGLISSDGEDSVSAVAVFSSGRAHALPVNVAGSAKDLIATFDQVFDLLDPDFEPVTQANGGMLPFEAFFSVYLITEEKGDSNLGEPLVELPGGSGELEEAGGAGAAKESKILTPA